MQENIEVKGNTFHRVAGIVFLVMACTGVRLLLNMELGEDIAGVLFLIVWIVITLGWSFCGFFEANKRVSIDEKGVYLRTFISKDFLAWSEIKDWGLSYYGQSRGFGEVFCLYFSKNALQCKGTRKKKLKEKMIKIEIFQEEYTRVVETIIPYCKEKTIVEPFVAKATLSR